MLSRAFILGFVGCVAAAFPLLGGEYQQTRDGKTQIWNNNPQPGDVATWSGDRDSEGYAAGFGTVTWYKLRSKQDREKAEVFARYFGKMVHGKLEGVVNVHSSGKTAHALFADGRRAGRWTTGPALTRNVPGSNENTVAVTKREPPKPPPPAKHQEPPAKREVDIPAEGPAKPAATPSPPQAPRQAKTTVAPPPQRTPPRAPADGEKKTQVDDSLRALIGPPTGLRSNDKATEDSQSKPPTTSSDSWLSKEDAIEMADKEARSSGYDLNQLHRPHTTYDENEHSWSLSYDPKDAGDSRQLKVTVDDRTKKVTVVSPPPQAPGP